MNNQQEGLIVKDQEQMSLMMQDMVRTMVAPIVETMMAPIMESIGTMLKNNTEAFDRIAASQTVMSDRMSAMERQIRLNTPIDTRQEKYLNTAMKGRARELLDKRGLADDKKAVQKLAAMIKRSVLSRYGVGTMREIPKHEYSVAMTQISTWMDAMAILDVAKEARERAEGQNLA